MDIYLGVKGLKLQQCGFFLFKKVQSDKLKIRDKGLEWVTHVIREFRV